MNCQNKSATLDKSVLSMTHCNNQNLLLIGSLATSIIDEDQETAHVTFWCEIMVKINSCGIEIMVWNNFDYLV